MEDLGQEKREEERVCSSQSFGEADNEGHESTVIRNGRDLDAF